MKWSPFTWHGLRRHHERCYVTVQGVAFWFSPEKLDHFMEVPRPAEGFPNVRLPVKPSEEVIFHSFTSQDVMVVWPIIHQMHMTPFWGIMHLIFVTSLDRRHTTKCPLVIDATHGLSDALDLSITYFLDDQRWGPSLYHHGVSLLLTQFLHAQLVSEGPNESKGYQLRAICKNTLSHSFAQLRRQVAFVYGSIFTFINLKLTK